MVEEKVLQEMVEGVKTIREKYEELEKRNSSLEERNAELKGLIEKVTKTVDELEIERKKIAITQQTGRGEKSPEFKAFLDWLRTGNPIPAEYKALRLSDQTTGGYLTTREITDELLKGIEEFSPIRTIARVKTTSKESVAFRKKTTSFAAQWTGETTTKAEATGLKYGLETIPTHELYARVDISNWDLEDSDFNLEAELQTEFAEQFGVAEGAAFVAGNGVAKPEGILSNASVGSIVSGSASAITADGLFKLYFEPKSGYIRDAKFIMNRATMLAASILKDGQNNYLLRRLGDSPAWNILGVEVVECPDMPDIASNAYPVAFGSFKRGYIIADRVALAVLRDPFTAADANCVRFHARRRVGGQVVLPEAIKKLKIST